MIHRNSNSYMIGEGEACLIKYGDFSLSEMTIGNSTFQSTMFFLSDEIIKALHNDIPQKFDLSKPSTDILKIAKIERLTSDIHSLQQQLTSRQQQVNLDEEIASTFRRLLKSDSENDLSIFLQSLSSPIKTKLPILFSDKQRLLLPLAALAKISGRDLPEFKKEIAQEYAVSPQDWLNDKRLEHAYFLLTHTPDSIENIAGQSGFDEPGEFSRLFKQKFGQSPQEVSETAGR